MPIPPATNDNASSLLPKQEPVVSNESEADDCAAKEESLSEVTQRITLLGKLIIPPAPLDTETPER